MDSNRTAAGALNFLKVYGRALLGGKQITTAILGTLTGVFLPGVAPLVWGLAGAGVLLMSFTDANDPAFIQKVLNPSNSNKSSTKSSDQTLEEQLYKLKELSEANYHPEVAKDFAAGAASLEKLIRAIQQMSQTQARSLKPVLREIQKLTDQLVTLAQKEQVARDFLEQESRSKIAKKIGEIEASIATSDQENVKKQLRKALAQKQKQLENFDHIENNLEQIDAHLASITAVLESSHSHMMRLSLSTGNSLNSADSVADSVQAIVSDLETLSASGIDVDIAGIESEIKQYRAETIHSN